MKQPIDFNTVGEDVEGGGGIGGSEKPDDQNESLKYNGIHPTLKSKAAQIVNQFGEECVVRIFNSKWQYREQGVKMFIEKMQGAFQEASNDNNALSSLNSGVMVTLTEIFGDKV